MWTEIKKMWNHALYTTSKVFVFCVLQVYFIQLIQYFFWKKRQIHIISPFSFTVNVMVSKDLVERLWHWLVNVLLLYYYTNKNIN